jgi:MFS family permease
MLHGGSIFTVSDRKLFSPTGAIGHALDRLQWRPVHTRITFALGIGWMLDAFEVNIIGNVLGVLQKLWDITGEQASLIVSVWLVGIMLGAVAFGYLADRFGRRKLFLITLLLYSSFTVLSALSPGYTAFLIFRFLTAIGVGAEYSAINAAIGELIPARYRGRASAAVMNFWPLGSILAGLVTLYFINLLPPTIGWRLAFALGALIAVFTIWVRKILPESPRWLAARGEYGEAASVAAQIGGGVPEIDAAATIASGRASNFFQQLWSLMHRYPGRLALGCALDFAEAAGYYGLFALLPLIILPHVGVRDENVPLFFILGNIGAAGGGILAAVALDGVGRKATVTAFYAVAALSMLYLGQATLSGSSTGVLLAFVIVNFCATGGWISAYATFSELFPTSLRATGIGFSVAFGRIGAAIAPPALVWFAHASIPSAIGLAAAFWLLGVIAMVPWTIWGLEARGLTLEALASE